jgi:hypothetical protein
MGMYEVIVACASVRAVRQRIVVVKIGQVTEAATRNLIDMEWRLLLQESKDLNLQLEVSFSWDQLPLSIGIAASVSMGFCLIGGALIIQVVYPFTNSSHHHLR